jgi:hypothetical protein
MLTDQKIDSRLKLSQGDYSLDECVSDSRLHQDI